MVPWLLFPVITQGDQLIDNLSINWMRVVVHVLLGLIFGIPVFVVVAGVRAVVTSDRVRARAQRARWLRLLPGAPMIAGRPRSRRRAVLAVRAPGAADLWSRCSFSAR